MCSLLRVKTSCLRHSLLFLYPRCRARFSINVKTWNRMIDPELAGAVHGAWLCQACSNALRDTPRLSPVDQGPCQWAGRVTCTGCRPIQGIEWTLSRETHQLPGTQSCHHSCLSLQSTSEVVLGIEMVLPWALQAGESSQPLLGWDTSLVWFCLWHSQDWGRIVPLCLRLSFRDVLASLLLVKLCGNSEHFSIWTPLNSDYFSLFWVGQN